jgi:hypothetical protein
MLLGVRMINASSQRLKLWMSILVSVLIIGHKSSKCNRRALNMQRLHLVGEYGLQEGSTAKKSSGTPLNLSSSVDGIRRETKPGTAALKW